MAGAVANDTRDTVADAAEDHAAAVVLPGAADAVAMPTPTAAHWAELRGATRMAGAPHMIEAPLPPTRRAKRALAASKPPRKRRRRGGWRRWRSTTSQTPAGAVPRRRRRRWRTAAQASRACLAAAADQLALAPARGRRAAAAVRCLLNKRYALAAAALAAIGRDCAACPRHAFSSAAAGLQAPPRQRQFADPCGAARVVPSRARRRPASSHPESPRAPPCSALAVTAACPRGPSSRPSPSQAGCSARRQTPA